MLRTDDGFPEKFSMNALTQFIERMRSKHLLGDVERSEFELAIFTRPIDEWPLGHLQDHRVSMPAGLAEDYLTCYQGRLAELLERFLSVSSRAGAREMIAEGFSLSPALNAGSLIEIRNRNSEMFVALLRGRLDEIWPLLTESRVPWSQVRAAMRMMLLYYGALEVQLIAARARAFAKFDFRAIVGGRAPTVGGLLTGWERDSEGIIYAAKASDGRRQPGRTPAPFAEMEKIGREWLAAFGLSESEPAPAELVDLLAQLQVPASGAAKRAIDAWRATAKQNPPKNPVDPKAPRSQPAAARMELSTLFDGLTTGEQIGFASLRLESLAIHANRLLQPKGTGMRHFVHWNNQAFREGADGPSLSLYFVNQAVIIEDYQTCLPGLDLEKAFLDWCKQDEGGKASTLLKSIRKRQAGYLAGRVPVGDEGELHGPARFDILPDYRLRIRPTSVSGSGEPGRRKRKNVLPIHIQEHGIHRLPRWKP